MELQKKWFVYMDDHHEGPFTPDEIFHKQKAGSIAKDSYVWCEGMGDWQMIEQVAELKSALQQFKDPPPSNFANKTNATAKLEPVTRTNLNTIPKHAAAKSTAPKVKNRRVVTGLVIGLAGVVILSVGAIAFLSRTAGEDTHLWMRPYLIKILDRAPVFAGLFKITPKLNDVKPDALQDLEQAMLGDPEAGAKVAIALSQSDPNRPTLYVATNLPDKTKFDLFIIGLGHTLLNRLSFSTQVTVATQFGLGHSEALLAVGGQPVPKGEYRIYLVESNDQDESVKSKLAELSAARSALKPPPEIPSGTKILFVTTTFIGGERDETYLTRLKAFHDKIKQSAERESQELKQYLDTLELQYVSLTTDFAKVVKANPKKMPAAVLASWNKTSQTWQQINGQLDQTVQTWTQETLQNEFFYGKTYALVKNAYDSIRKLFALESTYVSQPQDPKAFEIQHGKTLSEARDALELLKIKVEAILKAPKTNNGLPTREG